MEKSFRWVWTASCAHNFYRFRVRLFFSHKKYTCTVHSRDDCGNFLPSWTAICVSSNWWQRMCIEQAPKGNMQRQNDKRSALHLVEQVTQWQSLFLWLPFRNITSVRNHFGTVNFTLIAKYEEQRKFWTPLLHVIPSLNPKRSPVWRFQFVSLWWHLISVTFSRLQQQHPNTNSEVSGQAALCIPPSSFSFEQNIHICPSVLIWFLKMELVLKTLIRPLHGIKTIFSHPLIRQSWNIYGSNDMGITLHEGMPSDNATPGRHWIN